MRRPNVLNAILVGALLFGLLPALSVSSVAAAPAASPVQADRVPPNLQEAPAEVLEGATLDRMPRGLLGVAADSGPVAVIIELKDAPLAVVYAESKAQNRIMAANEIDAARARIEAAQAAIQPQIKAAGARVIGNMTAAYNGFLAYIEPSAVNDILAVPGVKSVHRAPEHTPDLAASVPLIRAPEVWDLGYTGQDMTIAIIDTGIDYTHEVLGGSGDPADYANNDPDVIETGTFPTLKVVAGYDFAGTAYDASVAGSVPVPDDDPLDEGGHGTHVASITAGNAAGDVATGVAPDASLVALKVFGAEGSTNLVMLALDWATNNYIQYGWPQVANMSLGSPYGPGNDLADPDIIATNNAVSAGIVVVASAGNSGNVRYSSGSPGTADKAIGVAGSTTGWATGPTIDVVGTAYLTQTDILYMPSAFANPLTHNYAAVTAPLAYVGTFTSDILCSTAGISPTNILEGKIALIQRGTCEFEVKAANAEALGAVAAVIFNNAANGNTYVTMADGSDPLVDCSIPSGMIARTDGLNLLAAHGQTVVFSGEHDVSFVVDRYLPANSVYPSSSRGPRATDSRLKPEVAAPGYNVFAAAMGTGTGGVSYSGTSMAAPHITGVAALIKQVHPDWTPEQVKAAMMNTATRMVDGTVIPRQGAGVVDAFAAVDTKVVAVGDDDFVSFSGYVQSSAAEVQLTRTLTVYNSDTAAHTFTLGWGFQPGSLMGVVPAFSAPTVMAPAGGSGTVDVTFTFDMRNIPAGYRALEEIFGYISLEPTDPGRVLEVPFYFTPRPYTELDVALSGEINDVANDWVTFGMTHTGVITSSIWVYPVLAVDPMETGTAGDIKAVGVDYGGESPYGSVIVFAMDAWAPWHTEHYYFTEFDVWIDIDEDGSDDFVLYNAPIANSSDYVVGVVDLNAGYSYTAPYYIYTDFNAGFTEWYVPSDYINMGADNTDFNFQVVGYDYDGTADVTAAGRFDYAHYPFAWGATADPGPDAPYQEAYVWVNDGWGVLYSDPLGAMLVDYKGNPDLGGQVYLGAFDAAQRIWLPVMNHSVTP